MTADDQPEFTSGKAGAFATTDWSAVVQAGQSPSPEVAAALEQLCRTYWPPLYSRLAARDFRRRMPRT